jgi:hypothetical protein
MKLGVERIIGDSYMMLCIIIGVRLQIGGRRLLREGTQKLSAKPRDSY